MKKSRTTVIGILVIILMIVITAGVSLAFMRYAKQGTKINSIKTNGITFLYTEESKKGRGITITNANPMENASGKTQTDNKFDFRIESEPGNNNIKYVVTARRISESNALDGIVDLYLTDQESSNPQVFKDVTIFSDLRPYGESTIEKVLYEKTISSADTDSNGKYEQDFRLRIWIDENADFSGRIVTPQGCSDSQYTSKAECVKNNETWTDEIREYPYNNKEFKIIVNVNAQATTQAAEDPNSLKNRILAENPVIDAAPTLKTPTSDQDGLYKSTDTNSGDATYYFRGDSVGNNVEFAGLEWKVVRINEDGTVRLVATTPINNNQGYKFSTDDTTVANMYYSNSPVKDILEAWYDDTLAGTKSELDIVDGEFCEQFKTAINPIQVDENNNAIQWFADANYVPNFKCDQDKIVHSKVGLLTIEEAMYSGNYPSGSGNSYINFISYPTWTTSPAGMANNANNWLVYSGGVMNQSVTNTFSLYPVINISGAVTVKGKGIVGVPYSQYDPTDVGDKTLAQRILEDNEIKTGTPNLNLGAEDEYDLKAMSGLYKKTVTNGFGGSNGDTYYFHGDVKNNYVDFAGKVWRVVRINEDGTVRLMLNDFTQTDDLKYNSDSYTGYYSETDVAKPTIEAWFAENITGTDLDKIATGNYFCESLRVVERWNSANYGGGLATVVTMEEYIPDLKCETDGNGHGLVNGSVGLLTVDEAMHAGVGFIDRNTWVGEHDNYIKNYIIKDTKLIGTPTNGYASDWWLMNPAGINSNGGNYQIWEISTVYGVNGTQTAGTRDNGHYKPVINLKAETIATYNYGTNHYVVQ